MSLNHTITSKISLVIDSSKKLKKAGKLNLEIQVHIMNMIIAKESKVINVTRTNLAKFTVKMNHSATKVNRL